MRHIQDEAEREAFNRARAQAKDRLIAAGNAYERAVMGGYRIKDIIAAYEQVVDLLGSGVKRGYVGKSPYAAIDSSKPAYQSARSVSRDFLEILDEAIMVHQAARGDKVQKKKYSVANIGDTLADTARKLDVQKFAASVATVLEEMRYPAEELLRRQQQKDRKSYDLSKLNLDLREGYRPNKPQYAGGEQPIIDANQLEVLLATATQSEALKNFIDAYIGYRAAGRSKERLD